MGKYNRIYFEERGRIETFLIAGWTLTAIGQELDNIALLPGKESNIFDSRVRRARQQAQTLADV